MHKNLADIICLQTPDAPPAQRVDAWLAGQLADRLSRTRIQQLIREGAITANESPISARQRVPASSAIRIRVPPPRPASPQAQDLPLAIVFEDDDLLVLDKPPGQVVHPAPGHADGTLVNALLHHCRDLRGVGGEARPGIVHRLDRDTSGLLVVAKHESALLALARAFKSRQVEKTYLALVHGQPDPPAGRIETTIARHPVDRKKMTAGRPHGRLAISHYESREVFHGATEVAVRIETGRTHQIRVHMACIGHPIAGDPLYGSRARDATLPPGASRQMLHAWKLGFPHPQDGRFLRFESRPPPDFENFAHNLRAAMNAN